jgi:SAM-dependent methyltransferase
MKHLRRFLQFKHKLPKGLDLACGTGLSSKALCLVAEKVIACDVSENMISQAEPNENIQYSISNSEVLNFENESFDIVTIASGFHWMNSKLVFPEIARVLKPKAWLMIYDHRINHRQANLANWYEEFYLGKFPAPARNTETIQDSLMTDFCLVKEENFEHQIPFTINKFVQYLCTQSNVSNAVNTGVLNYQEIEIELKKNLSSYFKNDEASLLIDFSYNYQLIRKV